MYAENCSVYWKCLAWQNNLFKFSRYCKFRLFMLHSGFDSLYCYCLVNDRAVFMIRRCDDRGCRRQDIICQAQAWWRLYNHVVKLLYCCQYAYYVTGIHRHSRERHENVWFDHAVSFRYLYTPTCFECLRIV